MGGSGLVLWELIVVLLLVEGIDVASHDFGVSRAGSECILVMG